MTLPASAAPWPQAAKTFPAGPTLVIAGVAVGALLVALYLAGFAFLVLIKADPRAATLLTLPRYAHYYGEREDIRRRLWVSAGVGVALTLAPGVALLLPKRRSLHGDARFATRREIARAGLLGDDGIILGRLGRRCLMLPGQQGVALAAPPRAGKGTGVVIPNALNWPGSLVC
ncbi:MAG: type IV secretory system conjugative DNA transfer family protein, partial [Gammaproteobacteria bacterium]